MAPNLPSSSTSEFMSASAAPQVPHTKPEGAEIRSTTHKDDTKYQLQIVWRNVVVFILLHAAALYGFFLCVTGSAMLYTIIWAYITAVALAMGITAGAHRLWSHRAYKANFPLRLILAFFQTLALQNSIYEWSRDHRVHHKFSETDADPHNSTRGFFFSHVGWLLCRKHPDVIRKGATVDMSDLEQDPIVRFQKKYYVILAPLVCFAFPTWVPWYFWGESASKAFYIAGIMRYVLGLHGTWLVNSAAHIWGAKPYDKTISPVENVTVAIIAFGEGWHNYHHVFPWDYKAAELGNYNLNFSTAFIDFFSKIGWAYDLKSVPVELVRRRAARTGDGSHKRENNDKSHSHHDPDETPVWGWGDKDMLIEDTRAAVRECRER